jgi:hypothetical protein
MKTKSAVTVVAGCPIPPEPVELRPGECVHTKQPAVSSLGSKTITNRSGGGAVMVAFRQPQG